MMMKTLLLALVVTLSLVAASDRWEWFIARTKGHHPSPRSLASFKRVGNDAYFTHGVIDPLFSNCSSFYNDTYRLNTQTGLWDKLPTSAFRPDSRAFQCSWTYNDGTYDYLYIHGGGKYNCGPYYQLPGQVREDTIYADMWALNLQTLVWENVTYAAGPVAPPRAYHICERSGNNVYISGGGDRRVSTNDVWKYNIPSRTWTLLFAGTNNTALAPVGRHGGASGFYGGSLYWTTGETEPVDAFHNDVWEFRTSTNTWHELTPDGDQMEALEDTCHTSDYRFIYVYGGDKRNGTICHNGCRNPFPVWPQDTLWVFDMKKQEWKSYPQEDFIGAPRLKRCGLIADTNDKGRGHLYMTSGYQWDDTYHSGAVYNQFTFILETH